MPSKSAKYGIKTCGLRCKIQIRLEDASVAGYSRPREERCSHPSSHSRPPPLWCHTSQKKNRNVVLLSTQHAKADISDRQIGPRKKDCKPPCAAGVTNTSARAAHLSIALRVRPNMGWTMWGGQQPGEAGTTQGGFYKRLDSPVFERTRNRSSCDWDTAAPDPSHFTLMLRKQLSGRWWQTDLAISPVMFPFLPKPVCEFCLSQVCGLSREHIWWWPLP